MELNKYLEYKDVIFSMQENEFNLTQLFLYDKNERVPSLFACKLLQNGCLCRIHDWWKLHFLIRPIHRFFAMGPSPMSSNVRLFIPLLLNLNLSPREL